MLEQLVTQARDRQCRSTTQRCYRALAEKLQAHEAAETRLLQMAFGGEAADHDVEEVE
jgi:hypothetical protein